MAARALELVCACVRLGAAAGCRCRVLLGSVRIGAHVLVLLQSADAKQRPHVSGCIRFGAWVMVPLQGVAQGAAARCLWQRAIWSFSAGVMLPTNICCYLGSMLA